MARHRAGIPLLIALGVFAVGVCFYSWYKRVEKQERARQFYQQQINYSSVPPPMSPTQQKQILEAMKRFPPPRQCKSSD